MLEAVQKHLAAASSNVARGVMSAALAALLSILLVAGIAPQTVTVPIVGVTLPTPVTCIIVLLTSIVYSVIAITRLRQATVFIKLFLSLYKVSEDKTRLSEELANFLLNLPVLFLNGWATIGLPLLTAVLFTIVIKNLFPFFWIGFIIFTILNGPYLILAFMIIDFVSKCSSEP